MLSTTAILVGTEMFVIANRSYISFRAAILVIIYVSFFKNMFSDDFYVIFATLSLSLSHPSTEFF